MWSVGRRAAPTGHRVRSNGGGLIQARYLVDASGRTSVLGRQFKIKKTYDHLHKLSIFAHYEGVWRPEGIDGTLTVLIRAVDRWFWLIPLSDERTSVGVVLDSETFRKSKLSDDDFLEQALAEQPTIAKRTTKRAARLEDVCRSRFLLSKCASVRRSLVAYRRCSRIHRPDFQQWRFSCGVQR